MAVVNSDSAAANGRIACNSAAGHRTASVDDRDIASASVGDRHTAGASVADRHTARASANVGDRHIAGAGTSAADWQAWPGLAAFPETSAATLVPRGRRAVIVAPHPDDELLGCGGLLQLAAAEDAVLLLVAVTDGGASHPDSALWPRERLLAARPRETTEALGVLGLENVNLQRIGLPDGEVAAHCDALRERLVHLLLPGDVVFVTWRHDGHPDHEACGHAAASAAERCGATLVELPIWGWHWARPGDPRVPWQRARRLDLPAPVLARKRAALDSYCSQLAPDSSTGRPPILDAGALERLLQPYEIYFV